VDLTFFSRFLLFNQYYSGGGNVVDGCAVRILSRIASRTSMLALHIQFSMAWPHPEAVLSSRNLDFGATIVCSFLFCK